MWRSRGGRGVQPERGINQRTKLQGIAVIATPEAAAAAVMSGVSITPGQPEPGEARVGVQSSAPCHALPRRSEVESYLPLRPGAASERVGRSGGPTQPGGGERGGGESVGRVTRVGSRGVASGREGLSVGHP